MHRNPTLLTWLLAPTLFLLACATPQEVEPEGAAACPMREDWGALALDDLIARLPDVGRERWRDPRGEGLILHPAATELRRRMGKGVVLSDEQWLQALIGSGAIRWRSAWPEGAPFAISLRMPRWVDGPRMRVIPRHPALRDASIGLTFGCGLAFDGDRQRAFHSELGFLPQGLHVLALEVEIEGRKRPRGAEKRSLLWRGELTLEAEIVSDLDEVLLPRFAPELVEALHRSVRIERARAAGDAAYLSLRHDDETLQALTETALSFEIELLEGDRIVEVHGPEPRKFDWYRMDPPELPPEHHSLAYLRSIPAPEESLEGWTLRLRGASEHALSWWGANSRFGGVLEIPLEEALRAERAL